MIPENHTPDVAGAPAGQPTLAPTDTPPPAAVAVDDAKQALRTVGERLEANGKLPLGTVDRILGAPSDLVEDTIDVPEWGCSVRIRSLTAAQSAKVRQASIDMSTGKPVMDWEALEKSQFQHGVIEPEFKPVEVTQLHHKSGPGFARVIRELDAISGTSPKAVKETLEAFQAGGGDGPAAE